MTSSFLPYQTKINPDVNQVLIFSPHHLLAYHLSFYLAQQGLQVTWLHLPPSQPVFSSPHPHIKQKQLTTTPSQASWPSADYAFLLYPFESRLNLTRFLPLLISTASKLALVCRFAQQQALLQDLLPQFSSSNHRATLIDHLFGQYLLTTDSGFTEKIFTHLWRGQSLTLPAHPQTKLAPLYVKDAVQGLAKATFTPQTSQQLFALSPLQTISLTDFALSLEDPCQEHLNFQPDLDLTQKAQDLKLPDPQLITRTQAQLDWQPQTDLNIALRQTFQYFSQHSPQPEESTEKPKTQKPQPPDQGIDTSPPPSAPKLSPLKKTSPSTPSTWLQKLRRLGTALSKALLITFLLFSPLIYFLPVSHQGVSALQNSLQQLRSAQFEQSLVSSQRSQKKFTTSRRFIGLALQVSPFSFLDRKLTKYDRYFDIGLRLNNVLQASVHSAQKGQQLYQTIIDPQSQDFSQINTSLQTDLDYLYNQLSLLQTSLNKLDIQSRLKYIHQLQDVKSKLPDLRQRLQLGIASLKLLPDLINTPTPQTYLLLIQNNHELRPTGGFIDTLALLSFQDGHLIKTKTLPVYQADSQLDGQVTPPAPLQQYLAEDSWYLRDSNWNPHFPAAAKQAQWFLQKELNQTTSGVVGLNLLSLQKLLSAAGPLNLSQPQLTINAQNLAQKVSGYSPPLDQPDSSPQIITPLTQKLLQELTSPQIDFVALIRALDQSLREQEITISLNSPQLQAVIEQNNWSGSIKKQDCPDILNQPLNTSQTSSFNQTYCTPQTFSLIEANLGINQANYYLSRRLQHTVDIKPQGQLKHHVQVSYQNNTPQNQPSSGDYKTFTRFYLPPNSQLISSRFNDQDLPPQNIELDPFLNLKVLSFYYTVPSGQTGQLEITFRSQEILSTFSPTSSLSLHWHKQSGTGSLPTTITINHPSSLKPEKITHPARTEPQSLIFTQPLNSDTTYAVQFSRQ